MATKAELEVTITDLALQIEDLIGKLNAERAEGEKVKTKLVKQAMRLAEEHDWCKEVFVSLKKMGLSDYIPDHWEYDAFYPQPGGGNRRRCDRMGCFLNREEAIERLKYDYEKSDEVRLWRVPGKGKAVLDPFEW